MGSAASSSGALPQIGGAELTERLAVGGMAEVFAGRLDGRDVVVKVLLPQYRTDREVLGLFAHEAALGERLRHSNLVPVLAHGDSPEGPFLISERVDGCALAALAQGGPLELPAVLALASDLLAALAFLHDASDEGGAPLGIVHRDLSPDNVLVDRAGRARLIDLGVARSALRDSRTRTGVVRGKLAYMAPEQVTGSTVDASADLYALGVILFELATGARYLEAESEIALLRAAEAPTLRLPSAAGGDPALDRALGRALARFPEERWASAIAMADALPKRSPAELEAGRAALAARVARVAPARSDGARSAQGPAMAPDGEAVPPEVVRAAEIARTPEVTRAPEVTLASEGASVRDGAPAPASGLPLRTQRQRGLGWPLGLGAAGLAAAVGIGALLRRDASDAASGATGTNRAATAAPSLEVPSVPSTAAPWPSDPSSAAAASAAPLASVSGSPSAPGPLASGVPSGVASGRVPPASSAATASSVAPATSASVAPTASVTAAPRAIDKASVQAKLAAVNGRIARAKAAGKDVSAAERGAAGALEALLDGRYEDADRRLDAIAATLPP